MWRHFGPASGSDPKIRDKLARYVLTVFTYGTNAGPAQVARHMRQKVSVHGLSLTGNQHITSEKLNAASAIYAGRRGRRPCLHVCAGA
ncbi:Tn3 family transposase [Streptomyces spectabilis]|uniref:Tn3 family transposase n=1 Tax=Streptomyces spectabilis TaxID=68270 RepID=UPI0019CBD763|nr:hypothetical protein GCM10010245_88490 [Streptomyces spectabilis]